MDVLRACAHPHIAQNLDIRAVPAVSRRNPHDIVISVYGRFNPIPPYQPAEPALIELQQPVGDLRDPGDGSPR